MSRSPEGGSEISLGYDPSGFGCSLLVSRHGRNHVDGTVIVALGASTEAAVAGALAALPEDWLQSISCPCRLLASPKARDRAISIAIEQLTATLANRMPPVAVTVLDLGSLGDLTAGRWVDVPAPAASQRFDTIRVPAWHDSPGSLCLVTRLPGRSRSTHLRPLNLLATLAHPRQRLAARLSTNRSAIVAELAAPWRPVLTLQVGTFRGYRAILASRDIVAAELGWLAMQPAGGHAELIGPWEQPAVQRATELGIGVAGPHELQLQIAPSAAGPTIEIVRRLRIVLGIQHEPPSPRE